MPWTSLMELNWVEEGGLNDQKRHGNVEWSMLLTSSMELNWEEEGVEKTRECNHDQDVR